MGADTGTAIGDGGGRRSLVAPTPKAWQKSLATSQDAIQINT
jgi:phage-related tail fiber protein